MQFLSASTAALGWLCILIFAVANGGLREAVLIPNLGARVGTALSGVILTAAVVIVTTLLLRWRPPRSLRHAAWLGVSWLVATLAFEFAFGLLVQGKAVQELLAAYKFQGGNLWPVVLLAVLVAPYAVAALMQHKQTAVRDDA